MYFQRQADSHWPLVIATVVAVSSFVFYWLTAYEVVTWWDNGEYTLAAATLGVPHPPGSLLAVLIGWPVAQLAVGTSQVYVLNLLAGLLAALTASLVTYLAARLASSPAFERETSGVPIHWPAATALLCGGLILAFSETTWLHAVKYTPYVLTALFTALILFATLRWWQVADRPGSVWRLALVALLVGLDFSVHRTNLLLVPGLLLCVLLRQPRMFASKAAWIAGLGSFAAGLAVHLVTIPISAARPFLNTNDPSSLGSLWDYISLKQYGGGFLTDVLTRKASFWDVQFHDFVQVFARNFASADGPLGIAGWLPLLLGAAGIVFLLLRNTRLGLGLLLLFLCTSLLAVFYFNIPADFFRPMARHYLPAHVIFGVFVAYGAAMVVTRLWRLAAMPPRVIAVAVMALAALAAGAQLVRNLNRSDGTHRRFAYDYAANLLGGLDENAILIAGGDADTFLPWNLQQLSGIRRDVAVINLHLLNLPSYLRQLPRLYSNLPLSLTNEEIEKLTVRPWQDTAIVVPGAVDPTTFHVPDETVLPNTVVLQVPPNISGSYLTVSEQVLLRLVRSNAWHRPIYLSSGLSPRMLTWLRPYCRMEGLVYRVIPVDSPETNIDLLRANVLELYSYQGLGDPDIQLDNPTQPMACNYYPGFLELIDALQKAGDSLSAKSVMMTMKDELPVERIHPPEQMKTFIEMMSEKMGLGGSEGN